MPRARALAGAGPRAGGRRSSAVSPVGRAIAWLELARWRNALIAAAGVALGAWWAAGTVTRATALVALVAVGLTALANAYNDLCDAAIDAVAHPTRPIPSGRAGAGDAKAVASVGALVAVTASMAVSPAVAAATTGVTVVMVAYSARVKARGLAGNAVVALVASLPFVFGAWSVRAPGGATLLYALAVPLHFARELAKDLDDASGDAAARRTLPLTLGAPRTRALLAAVLIVFAFGATAAFVRGGALGALLLAPALACCAAAAARARAGRSGAPALLKAAMLLAMGAALAARAGRLL